MCNETYLKETASSSLYRQPHAAQNGAAGRLPSNEQPIVNEIKRGRRTREILHSVWHTTWRHQ